MFFEGYVLRRRGVSRRRGFFEERRGFFEEEVFFEAGGFFDIRLRRSKTPYLRSSGPKIEEPHLRSSSPKIEKPPIFDLQSRRLGRRSPWAPWFNKHCNRSTTFHDLFTSLTIVDRRGWQLTTPQDIIYKDSFRSIRC